MKTALSYLMRLILVMGVLFALGSPAMAQAAGPQSQPSSPQDSVWFDGAFQETTTLNCYGHYTENGISAYVGYTMDSAAGLPKANTVYYIHVIVFGLGNPCAGSYAYIDLGLPPNTSFAVSTSNPVYCFLDGNLGTPTDCGLTLVASSYHSGMYEILGPRSPYVWPVAQGHNWEFQIPVVSTTAVSGSNLQADVQGIDGVNDQWITPTVPVIVAAAPTLPGSFGKNGPANNAVNQPASLTLSWGASSGAASYDYCLETTYNATCNTSWTSTGSAASKALSGLVSNTKYYWQVRANNSAGGTYADGSSSAFWSFTTQAAAPSLPGSFAKSGPANNAANQPINLTLSWGASSGAASYDYCLETTYNATCNTSWISTGSAASKALSGLVSNTKYYWQVRANNSAGSTYADGSSSTFWSFTTQTAAPTLPGSFGKSGPANNAVNQPASLTLSWGASSGAASYDYCLETTYNAACNTSWISTGSATSIALSGLVSNTKYYWQVRANNSAGSTYADDSSSAFWSFTTQAPATQPPAAFAKIGPSQNATGEPTNLTLSWNASSGADSYEVCVATTVLNNQCNTSWVSAGLATSQVANNLKSGTKYFWQVRANNAKGTTYADGGVSNWWSFTVAGVKPSSGLNDIFLPVINRGQ